MHKHVGISVRTEKHHRTRNVVDVIMSCHHGVPPTIEILKAALNTFCGTTMCIMIVSSTFNGIAIHPHLRHSSDLTALFLHLVVCGHGRKAQHLFRAIPHPCLDRAFQRSSARPRYSSTSPPLDTRVGASFCSALCWSVLVSSMWPICTCGDGAPASPSHDGIGWGMVLARFRTSGSRTSGSCCGYS